MCSPEHWECVQEPADMQPVLQRTLTPSSHATVALLMRRGVNDVEIARFLGLEQKAVQTVRSAMPKDSADFVGQVGKLLLSAAPQQPQEAVIVEPHDLCCPISLCLFSDPVVASDGHVYERESIQGLIGHCSEQKRLVSPLTREILQPSLFPAHEHRRRAHEWREQACDHLCELACTAPEDAALHLERCWEYLEELGIESQATRTRQLVDACVECSVAPAWNNVIDFFLQGRAEQLIDRWTGLRRIGLDLEMIPHAGLRALQRAAQAKHHEAALAAVQAELENREPLRPQTYPAVARIVQGACDKAFMDTHTGFAQGVQREGLQSRAGTALERWGPQRSRPWSAPTQSVTASELLDVEVE